MAKFEFAIKDSKNRYLKHNILFRIKTPKNWVTKATFLVQDQNSQKYDWPKAHFWNSEGTKIGSFFCYFSGSLRVKILKLKNMVKVQKLH